MNAIKPGKVAVVSGGASGIGLLTVKDLVTRGYTVAVIDVNQAALDEVRSDYHQVVTFTCDTSDQQAVESVVNEIAATLGAIDRLVHCAAIMPGGDLANMDTEAINRVIAINVMGTVNITKATLPSMLERDAGELVVVGSMSGSVLTHGLGAYSASKAATNAYVEVLQEENTSNVHIMLVNPPMVDTPLLDQAVEKGPASMKSARSSGQQMVSAQSIVDAINTGLQKRSKIVYPGNAKSLVRLRRFAPSLLWRIMRKANGR